MEHQRLVGRCTGGLHGIRGTRLGEEFRQKQEEQLDSEKGMCNRVLNSATLRACVLIV